MKRLGKVKEKSEKQRKRENFFFFFFLKNWAKGKIGRKKNHNSIGITVKFEHNLTEKVNLNKSKVRGLNWYDQNLEDWIELWLKLESLIYNLANIKHHACSVHQHNN